MGTSGLAKGSREVMDAFVREIERRELEDVEVAATGSSGVEDLEPIVTIEERDRDPVVYAQLTADVARKIVAEHIIGGQRVASHVLQRQLPGEVK
jgi:NADP-reducing hydrogenase subunit HndB